MMMEGAAGTSALQVRPHRRRWGHKWGSVPSSDALSVRLPSPAGYLLAGDAVEPTRAPRTAGLILGRHP
jgi:hypothetical protein